MEGIKHESSHHGCVQSLTINKDGQDIAVCAILPGGYRLGPARRQLNLTVLSGRLFVNGKFYGRKDGSCTIIAGAEVNLRADEETLFICYYK